MENQPISPYHTTGKSETDTNSIIADLAIQGYLASLSARLQAKDNTQDKEARRIHKNKVLADMLIMLHRYFEDPKNLYDAILALDIPNTNKEALYNKIMSPIK